MKEMLQQIITLSADSENSEMIKYLANSVIEHLEFRQMVKEIDEDQIWKLRGEVERLVGHRIWIRPDEIKEGVNTQ